MRRLLPSPLLSLALFALWLALNHSMAPGHLIMAALLAILMPILLAPLRPYPARIRHPLVLMRLILTVGHDVILSNLSVGWGVLRSHRCMPRGAFVRIPLELRSPAALAALSPITTVVPGTVWCELMLDRSSLLLHVFDLDDEAEFIAHFKSRYERPLKEIFE